MATTEACGVRVKGGSIRSKLVYVRETFGDEAEKKIRRVLDAAGVGVVLEASWYDYELFDAVLRAIADRHFAGNLAGLQQVGRFSARFALNTTYQVFLRARDIHGFLCRLARLHGRYYDQGKLSVSRTGETRYELLLAGQPLYYPSDLQVAAGFYAGAAEVMSCRDVACDFQNLGDRVRFDLRWS